MCTCQTYKATKCLTYKMTKCLTFKVTECLTFKVSKWQTFQLTKLRIFQVTKCGLLLDSHFECCWLALRKNRVLCLVVKAVGCGCSLVHDKTLVHSAPELRCLAFWSCIPTVADLQRQSWFSCHWGKPNLKWKFSGIFNLVTLKKLIVLLLQYLFINCSRAGL